MAGRLGVSVFEWENMTPAEFNAFAKGHVQEQQEKEELTKANLYALAVMVRAAVHEKRMPAYDKFFGGHEARKKIMTDEEMFAAVFALNKAMGGIVKTEE